MEGVEHSLATPICGSSGGHRRGPGLGGSAPSPCQAVKSFRPTGVVGAAHPSDLRFPASVRSLSSPIWKLRPPRPDQERQLFSRDWRNPFDKVFILRSQNLWQFSSGADPVKHAIRDAWRACWIHARSNRTNDSPCQRPRHLSVHAAFDDPSPRKNNALVRKFGCRISPILGGRSTHAPSPPSEQTRPTSSSTCGAAYRKCSPPRTPRRWAACSASTPPSFRHESRPPRACRPRRLRRPGSEGAPGDGSGVCRQCKRRRGPR